MRNFQKKLHDSTGCRRQWQRRQNFDENQFDEITPTDKKLIFQFYSHLIWIVEQRFFLSRSSPLLPNNIEWKNDAYYSWWHTFLKATIHKKGDIVAPNLTSAHDECWRNLQNEQRKWQTGIHFIPFKIWIFCSWFLYVAFFFIGHRNLFAEITPKMWIVFVQKKMRERKKHNHCNFRGAHCQRKFMDVIHQLLFSPKIRLYFCRTYCSLSASFWQSPSFPAPNITATTSSGCNWQSQDKELCKNAFNFHDALKKKGDDSLQSIAIHLPFHYIRAFGGSARITIILLPNRNCSSHLEEREREREKVRQRDQEMDAW